MAASEESCDGNPDFAVICSFITKFGNDCGVNITIPDLQQMLEDTKNAIHEDLAELHIHLLRRGRKRVTKEKWEKSLIKFCHEYSSVDAWELERFGYKKAKLSVKLELLKRLLELQFDSNAKFKSEVNKHEAESLRIPPVGRDMDGQLYWYQLDKEYNMRLYRQKPEEENSWQLLCSNTDHLRNLLSNLQKNITKDLSLEELSKMPSEEVDSKTLKMETGGDDLTSHISETKPTTIIIKTEKKEVTSNTTVTDTVKPLEKKNDEVTLLEQEKPLPNKEPPSDKEIKSEKYLDSEMDTTEVAVKKEVKLTHEEVIPMDVDDCKPDKSISEKAPSITSKSDVEMADVEKVTDIKTQVSSTDKCLSKDSLTETHLSNKDDSSKVILTSSKTIPFVEQTSSEDLSMEHTTSTTVVPSKTKHDSSKGITLGDNLSSNVTSPAKEHAEEKYKGGKIKLYEKWSNEKKLASAALSSPNSKQNLKGVGDPSANDKVLDLNQSSGSSFSKTKSQNLPPAVSQNEEAPMDLSVSIRNDDAVPKNIPGDFPSDLSIGKKRPISEQNKTNLNNVELHAVQPDNSAKCSNIASEAPRPFKKKHLSMAIEESNKEASDLNRKSVIFEVKNSKLLNQLQDKQHGGDALMKDKTPSNSGLSHLQALQNMCNENPMTCFQSSVIHSASPDKRLLADSLPKFSPNSVEKPSYNEATCDNISQKYKFSNSQLSGDVKPFSETDVPTPLLKSNVQSSSETMQKELTSPQLKPSSVFKSLIPEVQEHTSNSHKIIKKISSESDLSAKPFKDADCPEIFAKDKSSSQIPKADSEKLSTPKKHSRTIDHSVASMIEKDYKTVTPTGLNEKSKSNCDNHLKKVTLTDNNPLHVINQGVDNVTENSLNCSNTKPNSNVLTEILSTKTDNEQLSSDQSVTSVKEADKSISSETCKSNLDISKVEPIQKTSIQNTSASVPNIELKSNKVVDTEVMDVSSKFIKEKSEEGCLIQSKTNSTEEEKASLLIESTKVNDSKLQDFKTDKTFKLDDSKTLNCDKNDQDLKPSEYADGVDSIKHPPSIVSESTNLKSSSKDMGSHLDKEGKSFDISNISVSSSTESSANSVVSAKESDKSNKMDESTISEEIKVTPPLIEVKDDKTSEPIIAHSVTEKSEHSKEENTNAKSILSDSSDAHISPQKDVAKKESSILPESSMPSTNPSKHLEEKANDVHLELSAVTKTKPVNNSCVVNELEPKKDAKEINGNLSSKTLSLKIENNEQLEENSLKDKISNLTDDQSDESKLDKQSKNVISSENKDHVTVSKSPEISSESKDRVTVSKSPEISSENKDCVTVSKSPAKLDVEGVQLELLSKDKSKDFDSNIKDPSPCGIENLNNKSEIEVPAKSDNGEECAPISDKDSTAEPTEASKSIDSKQSTRDANLKSKEKEDSANLIKTSCEESETAIVEEGKDKAPLVSDECEKLIDSDGSLKKHTSKKSKSSKVVSDEIVECSGEEKDKTQENVVDASKKKEGNDMESPKAEETVDKEGSTLTAEASDVAKEKTPISKELEDKVEESSEITSKQSKEGEKKDSVKSSKESKSKKSSSKLKNQEFACQEAESDSTSPKSLNQLDKKCSTDHQKSHKKDKKCKDVKNSTSVEKSPEKDSLTGQKKECPEPLISKDSLKNIETKPKCSTKSEGSIKTRLKINVKNPLGRYFIMQSSCLESKMRHPSFEKSKKVAPPIVVAKPKLITTFSMDTTDEVRIIHNVSDTSPNKKKRGRLRQPADPSPKKATPTKASLKASPKSSKKPAAHEEKEGFNIPEGFLEILSNTQSEGSSAKKETQRKSRGRKLQISAPSLENSESESAPIKRSRRIQDIQQKKMSELAVELEREQRIFEQMAKKSVKKGVLPKSPIKVGETKSSRGSKKFQPPTPEETCMESKRTPRKMNSRSRNMTKMHLLYEDESKDSEFSTSRETEKSKKRRKGRSSNGKKGYKPWDLSSESESTLEELTEEEEEEHEEPLVFEVNEDEFACEEVDENAEVIVVRRARTAKKIHEDTTIEETVVNDDKPCSKCGKYDKPEWILLCDKCDSGYHTSCLIPPLMIIPEGDWYCQPCEHIFLCEWIQKELHTLEVVLKQREREELRKQRLAYVGISLDNVLKPEKKEESDEDEDEEGDKDDDEEEEESEEDVKERKHVKSRRREDSSSEEERHKKLYGKRSVRARRTVNYQFKEYDELIASAIGDEMLGVKLEETAQVKEVDDDEENDSDKAFQAKFPKRKKRKTTRLNDLDASDDEDSGEEYKGSSNNSDSEQTAPPSASGSDSAASGEWKIVKTKGKKTKRKGKRGRRDDSDEDWDDEDGSDGYRPVTRRAKAKSISYREISSEDEWDPKPKAVKKRKKSSSSEDSEASYKKKKPKTIAAKKKKRVRKWASSDSSDESERSINFSESSGSEDKWKVKKSSTSSQVTVNKKVLSSDENESSQESAPKKKPNKIVSDEEESEAGDEEDEEEEEEGSSEEEEDDDEEEEEEDEKTTSKPEVKTTKPEVKTAKPEVKTAKPEVKTTKPEVKATKPEVKATKPEVKTTKPEVKTTKPEVKAAKLEEKISKQEVNVPKPEVKDPKLESKQLVVTGQGKVADALFDLKEDSNNSEPPVEPIKEKVVVSTVQDKPPQRAVKKDATKMVPCVIPYDKSPKSGHGAIAEEESDKEVAKERENLQNAPKPVPYKTVPQQQPLKSVPKLHSGVVSSAGIPPKPIITTKTVNVQERRPFTSSIVQPFSNLDEDVESDDEVPLERIPTAVPNPIPSKPLPYEREAKYTPAKELPGFTYTAPEEKCFPPTYTHMPPFQDYSSRPSPLKPSLVETYNSSSPSKLTPLDSYNRSSPSKLTPLDSYPGSTKGPYPLKPSRLEPFDRSSPAKLTQLDSYNRSSPSKLTSLDSYPGSSKGAYPLKPTHVETYNRSSPSKLTPLDSYSRSSSPKGFISLDSYSKKKQHFYGNPDQEPRPPVDTYQREIGFPPETQFPPSPNVQRDPDTPPRFHSQYPDSYGPPRSPEYYHQNSQYYQGGEPGRSRPAYQPNYGPLNPYVATPVPQPNGGFMIDTLLRARNPEDGEDELTGVTDIVSYITQE